MNTTIIIFTLSLVFLIFLFAFKMREEKTGKSFLRKDLRERADEKTKELMQFMSLLLSDSYEAVFSKRGLARSLSLGKKTISSGVTKKLLLNMSPTIDSVRGKKLLKSNGNVSKFLKDIREYKQENGGGEIT